MKIHLTATYAYFLAENSFTVSTGNVKCFVIAVSSKGMHQVFLMKNHLTATYPYIRVENISTGCTSILRRLC